MKVGAAASAGGSFLLREVGEEVMSVSKLPVPGAGLLAGSPSIIRVSTRRGGGLFGGSLLVIRQFVWRCLSLSFIAVSSSAACLVPLGGWERLTWVLVGCWVLQGFRRCRSPRQGCGPEGASRRGVYRHLVSSVLVGEWWEGQGEEEEGEGEVQERRYWIAEVRAFSCLWV